MKKSASNQNLSRINIVFNWQITTPDGIDQNLSISKVSYMRNAYIGTFSDLNHKILDVIRGTKSEFLHYLKSCKRAVRKYEYNRIKKGLPEFNYISESCAGRV